ncbi:uncharacterized protein [Aristolochia californica]|uniref:uncharacterized protein n=1 Tax=Aristolochia californica TaxID=171875 RepID=UPI0035DD2C25
MKATTNLKRREEEFRVGVRMFVNLRPYRQRSLATRRSEKLAARFYGPFEVVSRVGSVVYKLQLPPESSVHPVFHVSQLRRAKGISHSFSLLPPQLNTELVMLVEPAAILNLHRVDKNGQQRMEVLVQWKDLPEFEATWEDFEAMRL